jgi:FtsP/CotA-like multicopper oxidase with cupredoxin domain
MTGRSRLAFLGIAVVILVVAFVVLRGSNDTDDSTTETTATPTVAETPGDTTTPTPSPKPTVDPGPVLTGGEVEKIRVDKGDTVRFQVKAPEDEEVHIHGYDIKKDVKAGVTTPISFKATIDGIFEIEFEEQGKQIASLRVNP